MHDQKGLARNPTAVPEGAVRTIAQEVLENGDVHLPARRNDIDKSLKSRKTSDSQTTVTLTQVSEKEWNNDRFCTSYKLLCSNFQQILGIISSNWMNGK